MISEAVLRAPEGRMRAALRSLMIVQGVRKQWQCMSSVLLTDESIEDNNQAAVHCQLEEGHTGKHRRSFTKLGKHGRQGEVVIEWDRNIDDSEDADEHETGGQG